MHVAHLYVYAAPVELEAAPALLRKIELEVLRAHVACVFIILRAIVADEQVKHCNSVSVFATASQLCGSVRVFATPTVALGLARHW